MYTGRVVGYILCFFFLISFNLYSSDPKNSFNEGYNIGKNLQDSHSSSDKIKREQIDPIQGHTQMQTRDNVYVCSTTNKVFYNQASCLSACSGGNCDYKRYNFDGKVTCQSTKEIAKINIINMTGSEGQLSIGFDLNMDGQKEHTIVTNNISGLCINGYYSCSPNTNQNCRYFAPGIRYRCSNGTEYPSYFQCDKNCPTKNCLKVGNHINYFETDQTETKTCFCTNSYCRMSFNNNLEDVMKYFVSSISSILSNELNMAISDTKFDPSTLSVSLYGADYTSCSNVGNSSNTVNSLKEAYKTGNLDGSAEFVAQMSDDNSTLKAVMRHQDQTGLYRTCSIKNEPYLKKEEKCPDGTVGDLGACWGGNSVLELYNGNWIYETFKVVNKNGKLTACLGNTCGNSVGWDVGGVSSVTKTVGSSEWGDLDLTFYVSLKADKSLSFNGYYTQSYVDEDGNVNTWGQWLTTNWVGCPLANPNGLCWGQQDISKTAANSTDSCGGCLVWMGIRRDIDTNELWFFLGKRQRDVDSNKIVFKYPLDVVYYINNNYYNSCKQFETNPNCSLSEEKVNNFYTVKNFNIISPPRSVCRKIKSPDSLVDYVVCDSNNSLNIKSVTYTTLSNNANYYFNRNPIYQDVGYFSVERTYYCKDNKTFDFSDAQKQADKVGNTLDYKTGNFQYYKNNIIASDTAPTTNYFNDSCVYSCSVKYRSDIDTTVNAATVTRNDISSSYIEKEERTCLKDADGIYTCPIKQGEIVLQNCRCIDNFNEAVSILSVVTQAAKDIICSK